MGAICSLPVALGLLTVLAASPAEATTTASVSTYVRLMVGHTEAVSPEKVLVVPGAIVLPGEDAQQPATDLLRVIDQLKESYRLDRIEPTQSTMVTFEQGKPIALPSVPSGPTVVATLLGVDDQKAVFRVTLTQNGKTLAEPTISVRRGGRAIVGSRDGAAAPYLFLLIEAFPANGSGSSGYPRGVEIPKLIAKVNPRYPEEARRAKLDGLVLLECTIAADGTVTATKVIRGEPMGMTEAAVEAVRQWRYQPLNRAECRCDHLVFWVTIRFRFTGGTE